LSPWGCQNSGESSISKCNFEFGIQIEQHLLFECWKLEQADGAISKAELPMTCFYRSDQSAAPKLRKHTLKSMVTFVKVLIRSPHSNSNNTSQGCSSLCTVPAPQTGFLWTDNCSCNGVSNDGVRAVTHTLHDVACCCQC
jgi:hypothetical protein